MLGSRVSHYEILEKIGAGGMGVVYKARDTRLDRLVALKFLPPHLSEGAEEKHRFLHEARAASALDHPNIGVVHEIAETPDGQLFIVMAYHDGETLKGRIARAYEQEETRADQVSQGLPPVEALEIARQIAAGLAAAHERGIVHRDIKPANVILTRDHIVKVIDFGLAKVSDATATVAGSTKGTAAYMSPEQATGTAVDARTDVWSLGVVLYEMLCGLLPFHGAHSAAQIHAIVSGSPKPLQGLRPDLPEEVVRIVSRAMEKDPARRFASGAEMAAALSLCLAKITAPVVAAPDLTRWIARPRVAVPIAALLVMLLAAAAWVVHRQSRSRWARNEAMPQIERLIAANRLGAAFHLAREAEKYLLGDTVLEKLQGEVSMPFSADSDPPGAEIEVQPMAEPESPWLKLGPAPVVDARVPRAFLRWRATKAGFASLTGARAAFPGKLAVKLDAERTAPDGMLRVPGQVFSVNVAQLGQLPALNVESFLIDKYETTNRQYREFVDQGAYQKREFWKHKFIRDGRELTWEQAMEEFRDSTGRPGPATWEAGRYPDGNDDYPVAGVSWFEAAAYAEFAGKLLPTIHHWYLAANVNTSAFVSPLSNFSRKGAAPVGKYAGISPNGAYDMAGNVKEWCWNATTGGLRFLLGGGWNEPAYQFNDANAQSPWDRSSQNGFRCIRSDKPIGDELLRAHRREFRDYSREKPVSDDVFKIVRELYSSDRGDLNPKVESIDANAPEWTKEKILIDAAYGGQRLPILLFLPKSARPPYQIVVYCPGAFALVMRNSAQLAGFENSLSFILKSGRAVAYPIYFGMYERRVSYSGQQLTNQQRREIFVNITKDLRRTIDYLETRQDVNAGKLAYMGTSYGASIGLIWSALDDRIRAVIYQDGGYFFVSRSSEVDPMNFAPRMKKPVLMLNGRYDFTFPLETSQLPMFRMLGTREEDKRHVIFDTAHDVTAMRADFMREVLNWLDKYLGKVN